MNVASLSLCKDLYGVSEWNPYSGYIWAQLEESGEPILMRYAQEEVWTYWPAYDLGYLLRKLPYKDIDGIFARQSVARIYGGNTELWGAYWECDTGEYYMAEADTPEDAACKLAIKLFKQGVLTK